MRKPKGQSILEYAVLLSIVLSSLLIMQVFVKRAYQGRLKSEVETLGSSQYSPKHTSTLSETTTNTYSISYTGGETKASDLPQAPGLIPDAKPIDDGVTVSFSSSATSQSKKEAVDSFATE